MFITTDFYKGTSITIEVSNRPYLDRTVPPSSQNLMPVSNANIKVFDPCGNLFIDCPMVACPDRIGYYLFRIQTDDEFPTGLFKVEIYLENMVPEFYGVCSPSTTGVGTTGTTGMGTPGTTGTPYNSNIAKSVSVKYFRLTERDM